MAIAFFDSLDDCDSVDVEFVSPDGLSIAKRLLVDSGFTGESCFVLPSARNSFALATVAASRVSGAFRGSQSRSLLLCRIPALSFERGLIAITTDVSPLSLPVGIDGIADLSFLRQFPRWGAEQTEDGDWRFYLSDSNA